ncbi:FkbM family methyltransferase [Streptomyces roseoverticillatus]|uniref:FkbM family methyltransferase n=1 Tax=Streptomyces roseoverticillatus TaxID=66429 RepID=UPI0004C1B660|nr:FkbM family methyltransferase [Streptomyces roseoverticillatus]
MAGPANAPVDRTYEITLPDTRRIVSPEPRQVAVLWRDVTGNELYARGVDGLAAGDVVFDVGANIGLAALFFTGLVPGLRVYAFEPAEDCFACLKENAARHAPGVIAVQAAVGAQEGTAELTYYPQSPAQSSLFPDEDEDRRNSLAYLANSGIHGDSARAFLAEMHQGRRCPVRVTTVAAAVAEHAVDEIALLKIDVERAEQHVLDGIGDACWPRVRRVVAEVHDTDGRLNAIAGQLTSRGFDVETDQEPLLAGTDVHMLLAVRSR